MAALSQPKITLVGAGGLSFGPTMVNDVIHTPELAGSRLVLHDIDEARLQRAHRFAARLNAANGSCVFSLFVRRNSAPFHQPDPPNSHRGDATQGPTGG